MEPSFESYLVISQATMQAGKQAGVQAGNQATRQAGSTNSVCCTLTVLKCWNTGVCAIPNDSLRN